MRIKTEEQKEEQKEIQSEKKIESKIENKKTPEPCRLTIFKSQTEKLKEIIEKAESEKLRQIIETNITEYLKTNTMHRKRAKYFMETINDLYLGVGALSDTASTDAMRNELINEYKFIRNTDSRNYCRALAYSLATFYKAPKSLVDNFLEFREQWRSYRRLENVEAPPPPDCNDPLSFYIAPSEIATKCTHLHFCPVPRPAPRKSKKCLIM